MKIKHAAIRQDVIVYVGKRHHNCIATMIDCGLPAPIRGEQGFVTDSGRFVDRTEAVFIAREAGQLKGRKKHGGDDELYSEDLY